MRPGEIWVGVDPGTTKSAWVTSTVVRLPGGKLLLAPKKSGWDENATVARYCRGWGVCYQLAIEGIGYRGIGVGADVFRTCMWMGYFIARYKQGRTALVIQRPLVTRHFTGTNAKKAQVWVAIQDLYGGQDVAVGGKKCIVCKGKGWNGRGRPECMQCAGSGYEHPPGILYPLKAGKAHLRDAFAVSLAAAQGVEGEEW